MSEGITPSPTPRSGTVGTRRVPVQRWGVRLVIFPVLLPGSYFRSKGSSSAVASNAQGPLPYAVAARALIHCIASSVGLLVRRRLNRPSEHVGLRLRFANGTSARVYRETVVNDRTPKDPCVLMIAFRLRVVRGWGHAVFRAESILNTPLFVGFPGFVSKLWLAHDDNGVYRGVYQWDGPDRAEHYARSLWRVLALGSVPGSIHYVVVPGLQRDEVLQEPHLLDATAPSEATAWWRLVDVS